MELESLRKSDVGTLMIWIPSLGNGSDSTTPLTYMQLAKQAFYHSAQQIEQLELSKGIIHQGSAVQVATSMWFITIEAYINSILRIACLVKNKPFNEFKKQDLGSRVTSLFDLLEVEKKPFYSGPFQRLKEFQQYRNELVHDRTSNQPLEFYKTAFSGNPLYANQVDVMQAAIIAVEVCNSFRNVIPKIDLMPQILIQKADSFFFEKLDILYSKILSKYFENSLIKHNLKSSLDLKITAEELDESKIFLDIPIQILVKENMPEVPNGKANDQKTSIGKDLFALVQNSVDFNTKEYFRLPHLYR